MVREKLVAFTEGICSIFSDGRKAHEKSEAKRITLEANLSSAKGLDGVLEVIAKNKKEAKEESERGALRDKILSL